MTASKAARSRAKPKLPHGHRAVMASRREPKDSRDLFPTPPWGTRALMEIALPHLGYPVYRVGPMTAWEPACGEGHMAQVLDEYFGRVDASDVEDYGFGVPHRDFLTGPDRIYDWIITNPPFGKLTEPFVIRALDLARKGVAMFLRSQWYCEGLQRYETIFRDRPPTLFAPFVERIPLCRGRWEPDGGTATAYCWLIWLKDAQGRIEKPRPTFWIPPGQRKSLSRPDDRARFAAWSLPQISEAAE